MKEIPSSYAQPGAEDPPKCFGDGDKVCPVDAEGIMQPQSGCLPCSYLRACLQNVMVRRGKLRIVEDSPGSKVTGFFKRWSNRKLKNNG
ncbi:MAG: hypothetical protein ABSF52_10280 [Syntrophobacteraceae bacterium]|jgi:hypothetical protein